MILGVWIISFVQLNCISNLNILGRRDMSLGLVNRKLSSPPYCLPYCHLYNVWWWDLFPVFTLGKYLHNVSEWVSESVSESVNQYFNSLKPTLLAHYCNFSLLGYLKKLLKFSSFLFSRWPLKWPNGILNSMFFHVW